ncbi:hypothetical protein GCM10010106_09520 [Thermopolyspora flexuosa]|nr:hypothetical protein GCM10010106_09520 [Thermopolyspora flexuosa]
MIDIRTTDRPPPRPRPPAGGPAPPGVPYPITAGDTVVRPPPWPCGAGRRVRRPNMVPEWRHIRPYRPFHLRNGRFSCRSGTLERGGRGIPENNSGVLGRI